MRKLNNTKPIIIFTALLPLVIGAAFLLQTEKPALTSEVYSVPQSWTIQIEEATLASDSVGILTEMLYAEARGERNSDKLIALILEIDRELSRSESPSSHLLTDLLRDLSLEHSNAMVRFHAYSTMITALESERSPYDAGDIAAQ